MLYSWLIGSPLPASTRIMNSLAARGAQLVWGVPAVLGLCHSIEIMYTRF
jgi:hypothetical protein